MHSNHFLRSSGERGYLGDRQRRGVAGENDFGTANLIDIAEYLRFDFKLLGRSLYHEIALCQRLPLQYSANASDGSRTFLRGDLAFCHFALQIFADRGQPVIEVLLRYFTQNYVITTFCKHMCDAVSHRASADHAYYADIHQMSAPCSATSSEQSVECSKAPPGPRYSNGGDYQTSSRRMPRQARTIN